MMGRLENGQFVAGDLEANLWHSRMIEAAESNFEDAVKLLKEAEKYLRAREPLPPTLADFLADAFMVACAKDESECPHRLAKELHLMAENSRPIYKRPSLGEEVLDLVFCEKNTRKDAATTVAKKHDVSISTVQKAYTNNKIRRHFEHMEDIRREAEKLADTLMQQGMAENAASNQAILTTAEKYGMNPKVIHYEYPFP